MLIAPKHSVFGVVVCFHSASALRVYSSTHDRQSDTLVHTPFASFMSRWVTFVSQSRHDRMSPKLLERAILFDSFSGEIPPAKQNRVGPVHFEHYAGLNRFALRVGTIEVF